ncbi:MAG: GMC family oxidoreductase N-terminal domain-containing protein [Thaumarchaeota archaeon]|nr:GMC family oxidoreductase N-terminal domain-containing protein [Nitrososphaerota archaeon]
MAQTPIDLVQVALLVLAVFVFPALGYAAVYGDAVLPILVGRLWRWDLRWFRYLAYFGLFASLFLLLPIAYLTLVAPVPGAPSIVGWLPVLGVAGVAYAFGALFGSLQLDDGPEITKAIIESMFPAGGPIVYGAADLGAAERALGYLNKVGDPYQELIYVLATSINSPIASWYLVGTFTRFINLSPPEKQIFLETWTRDPNLVLRSLSQVFKALACLGYYGDPRVWQVIRYPGPFVLQYPDSILPELKVPDQLFLEGSAAHQVDLRPEVVPDEPKPEIYGVKRVLRRQHRYKAVDGDITVKADVCIIGSGAGGAVLARELSRNAKVQSVVVIERGSYNDGVDFNQQELDMLPEVWKKGALQFNNKFTILIGQGQTLGGTTVINHAICIDTPKVVLQEWKAMGVGDWITDPADFQRGLEEVKKAIHVKDVVESEINGNNRVLREGAEKLGIPTTGRGVNPRNCLECKQCGFDHLGCHYDTKQSTLVTYIPKALETGNCKIYCDAYAERITFSGDRADGVDAKFVSKAGDELYSLRVDAKLIIVAAGTINSSALLLRSKLPNAGQVGRGLAIHPSPMVIAEFSKEVSPFAGIPMSYHISQDSVLNGVPGVLHDDPLVTSDDPGAQRGGFMLEAVFPNLGQFAAFLPGMGAEHKKLMTRLGHYAAGGILIRDTPKGVATQKGAITLDPSGEPQIEYCLDDHDKRNLSNGIRKLTEIYFHAGADKVMITYRKALSITREEYERNPRIIDERILPENCGEDMMFLGAVHPQGGNRMGVDPRNSVVDEHCVHHAVRNVVVCDASVFPTATGVNPMLTVMGIATRVAEYLNKNWNWDA